MGPVNEAGLRGAKAMRDMQQYQMAVRLKKYMAVPLAEWNRSTEVSADCQSIVKHLPINILAIQSKVQREVADNPCYFNIPELDHRTVTVCSSY